MKEYYIEYFDVKEHDWRALMKYSNIKSASLYINKFRYCFPSVKYRLVKKVSIDTYGKKY